jgi:hypothetical protein
MGIFKIKIIPIKKEKDYEVKIIGACRKNYKCYFCKEEIKVKDPCILFTKKILTGSNTKYITHRAHYVPNKFTLYNMCTTETAKDLGVTQLP